MVRDPSAGSAGGARTGAASRVAILRYLPASRAAGVAAQFAGDLRALGGGCRSLVLPQPLVRRREIAPSWGMAVVSVTLTWKQLGLIITDLPMRPSNELIVAAQFRQLLCASDASDDVAVWLATAYFHVGLRLLLHDLLAHQPYWNSRARYFEGFGLSKGELTSARLLRASRLTPTAPPADRGAATNRLARIAQKNEILICFLGITMLA